MTTTALSPTAIAYQIVPATNPACCTPLANKAEALAQCQEDARIALQTVLRVNELVKLRITEMTGKRPVVCFPDLKKISILSLDGRCYFSKEEYNAIGYFEMVQTLIVRRKDDPQEEKTYPKESQCDHYPRSMEYWGFRSLEASLSIETYLGSRC